MFGDEQILAKKVAELTEENNRLLHKLVRAQRWALAWSLLRWAVIIALSFGAYYFIQPYLDFILGGYEQLLGGAPTGDGASGGANLPNFGDLSKLLQGLPR